MDKPKFNSNRRPLNRAPDFSAYLNLIKNKETNNKTNTEEKISQNVEL